MIQISALDLLSRGCASARSEVVLIAPFIKFSIAEHLIAQIDSSVPLTIVTRWHFEEIVAGVSDPDIWKLVSKRSNTSLFLVQNLHAKAYILDDVTWVGSANLTRAALTASARSNLELLISVPTQDSAVVDLKRSVDETKVLVDSHIYEHFSSLQADYSSKRVEIHDASESRVDFSWLPASRSPENVISAAVQPGNAEGVFSLVVSSAAKQDLSALGVSVLDTPSAKLAEAITFALKTHPTIEALRRFTTQARRFGELREWVKAEFEGVENSDIAAQNLFRWALFFLAEDFEYSRPRHSELIRYRRTQVDQSYSNDENNSF